MTNWKQGELPPVGTECEYLWYEGAEWRKAYCVAHYVNEESTEAVLCDMEDNIAVRVYAREVRSIKTPAEIERERVVTLALDSLGYDTDDFKDCVNGEGQSELVDNFIKLFKDGLLVDPAKRVKALSRHAALGYYHMSEALYNELLNDGRIQGVDNE